MRASQRPRIVIGDEIEALLLRLQQHVRQVGRFFIRGKLRIPIRDRHLVPRSDADRVGVGKVGLAVAVQGDERMGIIHHRSALAQRTGGKVMRQPQRVPHLMRCQLPHPCQDHGLQRIVRGQRRAIEIRIDQRLRNHKVLARAQRSQRHLAFDDLARPRIDHAFAVGPSPGVAMHPLDHVVANVHRVRALRQHLDPECIAIACSLEGLVPPASAFDQRGAHRLRRAAIDIVGDRLYRIAHGRGWILLLQPVPGDEELVERRPERRGVIPIPVGK